MKRFEFKLETLLKLKLMNEKKTKFELGSILNEMQKIKDDISKMNEDIMESYDAYDAFLTKPSCGDMLQFFPEFVKTKKSHIEAKENFLFGLTKKYDEKVLELNSRKADVKVMEGLKEKEEIKYNKVKARKDRENLEEFVSIRHFEKKRAMR